MNLKRVREFKKELRKAEKAGKLETWKNRIGLAMELVQVAMMATAAAKGLKVGKAARRPARASAKHAARRKKTR